MRTSGRAFELKLCCPRCGAMAREDGFVGHTYFCHCGWSIRRKVPEKQSMLPIALMSFAFIATGVWLFLLNDPYQSIALFNHKILSLIQLYK